MLAQHPWATMEESVTNGNGLFQRDKPRNGSLVIRTLDGYHNQDELILAQRLRYRVFHDVLDWVPGNEAGIDSDNYDVYAAHFAAVSSNLGITGYVRVIKPSQVGFMLERDFARALGDVELDMDVTRSIEVSRLCVNPAAHEKRRVLNLLYKAMFQWSLIHNKRYWYIVVGDRYLKALRRQSFPFKQIGPGCDFGDGNKSVAAVLDLQELEVKLVHSRPKFLKWLRESHLEWEDSPEFSLVEG